MKYILYLILFCFAHGFCQAQQTVIFDTENIRSAQLVVDDDPLLAPVIEQNSTQMFTLSFDYMSHLPQRLVYHIAHCDYKWQKGDTESLFESDYLMGLNGQVIEDYTNSLNTNQNYTHYTFSFPNSDLQLRLSGNYTIEVFTEDEYEGENSSSPLLRAEFCVVEPVMGINAQVTSNTDIDFNDKHQQLSYSIGYGKQRVTNVEKEIHTVVLQNMRRDNAVVDLLPSERNAAGIKFLHCRDLIFTAGNEFHKFESIDLRRPTLGVDNIRWYEPYYHITLFPNMCQRNYTYDEDQDGAYVLRNAEWDTPDITSEYTWVHFTLKSNELIPGGPIYVCGNWTNGSWDPSLKMEYDEQSKEYRAKAFLKQGYYNYQYRQLMPSGVGSTAFTDGNFYETENQYTIFVYYRPMGARYDRLVGYKTFKTTL